MRPILSSGPMVNAILAGRKTMTRRVMKPQPPTDSIRGCWYDAPIYGFTCESELAAIWWKIRCPYGKPGDLLWVRETYLPFDADHVMNGKRWAYAADTVPGSDSDRARKDFGYKWKPSIFMPREASRITLEITDVRVQRLHEITESDARAEGLPLPRQIDNAGGMSAGRHFEYLWEDINGKRPGCAWADNPWVWVIAFDRVETREER